MRDIIKAELEALWKKHNGVYAEFTDWMGSELEDLILQKMAAAERHGYQNGMDEAELHRPWE